MFELKPGQWQTVNGIPVRRATVNLRPITNETLPPVDAAKAELNKALGKVQVDTTFLSYPPADTEQKNP